MRLNLVYSCAHFNLRIFFRATCTLGEPPWITCVRTQITLRWTCYEVPTLYKMWHVTPDNRSNKVRTVILSRTAVVLSAVYGIVWKGQRTEQGSTYHLPRVAKYPVILFGLNFHNTHPQLFSYHVTTPSQNRWQEAADVSWRYYLGVGVNWIQRTQDTV